MRKNIWLIDGYNLMFKMDFFKDNSFSRKREDLLEKLSNFAIYRGEIVVVVFDGDTNGFIKGKNFSNKLRIVYTTKDISADEYIIEFPKNYPDYMIKLVTSDQEIHRKLENVMNVKIFRSEDFLRDFIDKRYNTSQEDDIPTFKREGIPFSEVKLWRKFFNL